MGSASCCELPVSLYLQVQALTTAGDKCQDCGVLGTSVKALASAVLVSWRYLSKELSDFTLSTLFLEELFSDKSSLLCVRNLLCSCNVSELDKSLSSCLIWHNPFLNESVYVNKHQYTKARVIVPINIFLKISSVFLYWWKNNTMG